MTTPLKIGNAQGFWGDSVDAPRTLLEQQPDLDYLTLDYLAEVSLSIMAGQRAKDPSAGYARDFVEVVRSLAPLLKAGSKCKLVANAGGLNPQGCAAACSEVLREAGCTGMRIGIVYGDDVLPHLSARANETQFNNLDTSAPLSTVRDRLVTANAYVGGAPIVDALRQGADIVITGRVADPCLIAGPAVFHYGWSWDDYDRIASALVAGHLIECGTQVTGGISTNWLDVPDPGNMGFPVIELDADGTIVVTKPANTG
ncbi:MAG: acyclic terpene utilization AtuA family protein, partial [Candidatus Hydrogenedentes bacterium]|nr:acyclic terpene utilization AtuA family protein [Candidatus Hydrogenedentota bacterium]